MIRPVIHHMSMGYKHLKSLSSLLFQQDNASADHIMAATELLMLVDVLTTRQRQPFPFSTVSELHVRISEQVSVHPGAEAFPIPSCLVPSRFDPAPPPPQRAEPGDRADRSAGTERFGGG